MFSLKWQFHCPFWGKCAKYPSVYNWILCQVKTVWKKIGNSKIVHFSRQPSYFDVQQKCFMGTSISSHRILQSHVLKGQNFIKSAIVAASSRTFLSKVPSFYCVWWWRTQWWLVQTGTTAELCYDGGNFTHHCLCTIIADVNTMWKTNNILALL